MASLQINLPNSWGKGSLWKMTRYAQVITFIGAGGKTTCVQAITQEIVCTGQRVIATTTTKVFPQGSIKGWKNSSPPPYKQEGACYWYVDAMEETGKWVGPTVEAVDEAVAKANASANARTFTNAHTSATTTSVLDTDNTKTCWVIEGDGARGLKLKCWEPHEPQIPKRTDCIVLVLDGGLWGNVLQAAQVHRPYSCSDLLGHVFNAEKAWRYFLRSPVFASPYRQMSWVILLNCHGENAENEDLLEPSVLLEELLHKSKEIEREVSDLKDRPSHLRLAAGDAKEGKLEWFDLW